MKPLAAVAVTRGGATLARRIRGADLFLNGRFILRGEKNARAIGADIASVVGEIFERYKAVVFVMAAGAVVRLIAPHLKNKTTDPAVVVLDEGGRFAVSLVSGHIGGANELARKIASATGATAVITTASDVIGAPAVDTIAGRLGCAIEGMDAAKRVTADIVNGDAVGIYYYRGVAEFAKRFAALPANVAIYKSVSALARAKPGAAILITPKVLSARTTASLPDAAVLRPKVLVAGIGCRKGAEASEIDKLFLDSLAEAGLSPLSVRNLATITEKRGEPGIKRFAKAHGLKVEYISAERLLAAPTPSGKSGKAFETMGVHGVCEPAALLSAGAGTLLVPKKKSRHATIALAEAASG